MRLTFGIMFLAMIIALAVCTRIARHSGKRMGFAAASLLAPLMLPVIGNMIIILSGNRTVSLIGCYLYYLGLDFSIAALIHFARVYCRAEHSRPWYVYLAFALLTVDVIQLLLNPLTHHAFRIAETQVEGFPYFNMIPLWGQQFHRAVDYLLLAGVIVTFVIRTIRAPRLQRQRYSVILFTLLLVIAWETAYIFSDAPVDRSMIGFGIFGLLIFYFSLYYRPMRLLDRMLSSVVSDQTNPIFFFDEEQRCIWMNRAGARFLNIDEQEPEKAEAELIKRCPRELPKRAEWTERLYLNMNGEKRYVEMVRKSILDAKGKADGFFIQISDLTEEQREAEQKLYNARHDRLTGLYNRDYLYECTRELLDQHPEETYLIISAEVSDLKVINDLYGNAFGDQTLKYCAGWLRSYEQLAQGCAFGRMGGDSFGVCIPEKQFSQERMEQSLSNFTIMEGETGYRMLIHVGIYRATNRDIDVPLMFDRAVLAMEGIKDDYHYHTAWYNPSMRDHVVRNRQISEELVTALKDGQIRPWLQPIVSREGKIVGAEALVRWIHPEEGIRQPGSFIPVFEKNGMIADVDRCIWRKACEILAGWKREEKDLFISVNISPRDFYLLDVPAELTRLVREYGLDPARLRLEITESVMMTNVNTQMKILRDLRNAGFIIEMDDFGSGYSSLNLLREMPVDVLKIDMVFLQQANQNARAKAIVEDIIGLSSRLGMASLTEDVETQAQYDSLMKMGCQMYQGYYFAKPMPEGDFDQLLSRERQRH